MVLTAENLTVGYGRHAVLADVCVEAAAGTLTVLIGANGSGKSTLLRTLTGSQAPLSGRILLDGDDLHRLSAAERARRLAIVLTDRTGGGGLRLDELVAVGRHPYSGVFGRLGDADRRAVAEAIEAVGLSHKRHAFVATLSDGERQKAMIARAVAQQTGLIVLDEPTSFLDVASRYEIMQLLDAIAASGVAVVLSTHDIAPAMAVADRLWVIADERLHTGDFSGIAASGILDRVYRGVSFNHEFNDFRPCDNLSFRSQ